MEEKHENKFFPTTKVGIKATVSLSEINLMRVN